MPTALSTIFKVFGMTRPGIESRFPGVQSKILFNEVTFIHDKLVGSPLLHSYEENNKKNSVILLIKTINEKLKET